jgi:plasmid stability protein
MEDEARDILKTALAQQETPAENLAATIRARLQPLSGVELELPAREPIREALDFSAS